jgi:Zinc knuckle
MTDHLNWWLANEDPIETPRGVNEYGEFVSGMTKEKQAALSTSDKQKYQAKATQGLEYKFTILESIADVETDKEKLKPLYNVATRIDEYKRAVRAYNMQDVFLVPNEFADHDTRGRIPAAGAQGIDLFSSYSAISLEVVKDHSKFIFKNAASTFLTENLVWSGTLLLNSCDEKLRDRLHETTRHWPVYYQTGPVLFKLMTQDIMVHTASLMRTVLNILLKLGVKDFDGENVSNCVTVVRGLVEQLENSSAMPHDAIQIVGDVFRHTSVDDFKTFVVQVLSNHEQGIKELTLTQFIDTVDKKYREMIGIAGAWTAGGGLQDSAFFNKFSGKCFNCGKEGHRAADCPEPRKEQGHGRGTDGACGRGRGGRGYRGGGCGNEGRGGRSDGRGRGRGRSGGRDERQVDPIYKTPQPGEPREKMFNGEKKYWCGRCAKWDDHTTDQHHVMLGVAAGTSQPNQEQQQQAAASSTPTMGFGSLALHF